ncbi:MAG: Glu-tRNA(Gln) amidotransferase subunit GatE [Bacteroidales bacterium]
MDNHYDPALNYEQTKQAIGYVTRKNATQQDYDRIGFMSGLEVHQQLDTRQKLFCRCPAGIYQHDNEYDAEVIRHMRPTLSELGEYDGTALMEFKTRKNIIYRLSNDNSCTYEVDDTPPFPLNRTALDISIQISLLKKLNIVGEVHITRKQYLDGSIPTGFQRTAIIGVEGAIKLRNKTVRLIQLSLEEDSCREISDVGHWRTFKTDRLGMPLIETVTYPDMVNPDEAAEACQVIRFLNRSTGKVRTGIGAARQDVNVSCRGGTRVEIKGVSHITWIPELTHNESFRQWALLHIRDQLLGKFDDPKDWTMQYEALDPGQFAFRSDAFNSIQDNGEALYGVNLPGFLGVLSHFTQPGKTFADEISERLKVVACLEHPNMTTHDALSPLAEKEVFQKLRDKMGSKEGDAVLFIRGPQEDMPTAMETIEERCRMAFECVPNETRKSFVDGTTVFERVLPGADRMYPDTDSAPIPLLDEDIQRLSEDLPRETYDAYMAMKTWGIPEDTYTYILRNNLFPLIAELTEKDGEDPVFLGTLFGHRLKFVEGHYQSGDGFQYRLVADMIRAVRQRKLDVELARELLPLLYQNPDYNIEQLLQLYGFQQTDKHTLVAKIPALREEFARIRHNNGQTREVNWLMGQLRQPALGNMTMAGLRDTIDQEMKLST